MSECPSIWKQLILRFALVLPFFIVGISGVTGFFSPFVILTGAIIFAMPLARLFSDPFGRLFFPNDRFDKPQPRFSIPAARRREGKFEEAITGYAALVEEHPEAAARAYIEQFDIIIVDLRDAERADQLYLEALDRLKAKADREQLATVYRDIRSRLVTDRHGVPERAPINTDGMHRSKPRT